MAADSAELRSAATLLLIPDLMTYWLSGVVGADMAGELVRAFLAAEFDGGERYRRRLEKIEAMEREAASA